ncbi:MAG: HAMP domain-containing histidine kinase [Lachnospiraceae bacterium]|nr:HAMP domain-containing histidine kinase [Lachnospiraceae bacterium]
MKKIRLINIVLNILIVFLLVACSISTSLVFSKKEIYMSKKELNQKIGAQFFEDTSEILGIVGNIVTFEDKYPGDKKITENGHTSNELKNLYDQNNNIDAEYKDSLANSFYYTEDNSNGYTEYTDQYGNYKTQSEVDMYGYESPEEYNSAIKAFNAIVEFNKQYKQYLTNKKYVENYNQNFEFYIFFTDNEGVEHEYSTPHGKNIGVDSKMFKSYLIYDKKTQEPDVYGFEKNDIDLKKIVLLCNSFTDYDDFYAAFSINSVCPFDDSYDTYFNKVITDKHVIDTYYSYCVCSVVLFAFALIIFVISFCYTGTDKKSNKFIYQIDYLWWDMVGIILTIAILIGFDVMDYTGLSKKLSYSQCLIYCCYMAVSCEAVFLFILSIVRRIKTNNLWKTSLIEIIFNFSVKIIQTIFQNAKVAIKVSIFFVVTSTLGILTFVTNNSTNYVKGRHIISYYSYGIIGIDILYFLFVTIIMWKYFKEYYYIIRSAETIANEDVTHKIERKMLFNSNRLMTDAINSMGEGISEAVMENTRNERLKSDLITNVSHDIKTPLTSIINYLDLLKMEDLHNEKARDYINILETKSHRLKVLTDDLVEASKLSSGVIKLEKNKLNLSLLINQSAGEFSERFEEKNLTPIITLPKEPVYINGDGRKMWRVIENLYSNMYKYAMENTRVYIDLMKGEEFCELTIKNISKSYFKVDEDDLTERFIRGDASRTTEGSGLGLSIAKSIIDRHDGVFKIILDGDLFKVRIKLALYKEEDNDESSDNTDNAEE